MKSKNFAGLILSKKWPVCPYKNYINYQSQEWSREQWQYTQQSDTQLTPHSGGLIFGYSDKIFFSRTSQTI